MHGLVLSLSEHFSTNMMRSSHVSSVQSWAVPQVGSNSSATARYHGLHWCASLRIITCAISSQLDTTTTCQKRFPKNAPRMKFMHRSQQSLFSICTIIVGCLLLRMQKTEKHGWMLVLSARIDHSSSRAHGGSQFQCHRWLITGLWILENMPSFIHIWASRVPWLRPKVKTQTLTLREKNVFRLDMPQLYRQIYSVHLMFHHDLLKSSRMNKYDGQILCAVVQIGSPESDLQSALHASTGWERNLGFLTRLNGYCIWGSPSMQYHLKQHKSCLTVKAPLLTASKHWISRPLVSQPFISLYCAAIPTFDTLTFGNRSNRHVSGDTHGIQTEYTSDRKHWNNRNFQSHFHQNPKCRMWISKESLSRWEFAGFIINHHYLPRLVSCRSLASKWLSARICQLQEPHGEQALIAANISCTTMVKFGFMRLHNRKFRHFSANS